MIQIQQPYPVAFPGNGDRFRFPDKLKKPWVIALLTLSFVCSLGMGYLSSQDFAEASMNWIAEGVNVVGQGTLLLSVVVLDKNGLSDLKIHRGEEV